MARRIPFLLDYVVVLGHYIRMTSIAQHLSTLVGIGIMAYAFGKGLVAPPQDESMTLRGRSDKLLFWVAGGLLALISGSLWVLYMRSTHSHYPVSDHTLFGLASWAGFFYGVCSYSVAKRMLAKRYAESESG